MSRESRGTLEEPIEESRRINRCENCGVLFAAGEKSEWFFNEEGTWFHSCDSGHVGSSSQKSLKRSVTMKKIPDFLAFAVAKRCHKANNEYRKSIGEKIQEDSLMDATAEKRIGVIQAVQWCYAHPDANPEDAHEQWRLVKRAAGWIPAHRTHHERKEHACLFPWASLPLPQRRKDEIFLETARFCFMAPWFTKALKEHELLSEMGIEGSAAGEGLEMVRKALKMLDILAAHFPKMEKTAGYADLRATIDQIGICLETVGFSEKYTETLDPKNYPVLNKWSEDGKMNSPDGPDVKKRSLTESEMEAYKHVTAETQEAVPAADGSGAGGDDGGRGGPRVGGPGNSDTSGERPLPPVESGRESEGQLPSQPQTPPELPDTGLSGSGGPGDSGGDGLDGPVGSPAPEIG